MHRLSDNIYALGAETSVESQLELLQLDQDRQVRVVIAVRKIQQHPSS
jgi:hypothetical protein